MRSQRVIDIFRNEILLVRIPDFLLVIVQKNEY